MFSKQNGTSRIRRAGKIARLAFLALSAILALVSTSTFAQTPKPLATPGDLQLYTNGIVWASVRQADGSVIFGGHFSQVNGVARNNIARLKPDGALDTAWFAEGSYFNVRTLAADAQGNVYIGTSAGTLRKVSVDGKLDPNWLPTIASNRVYALAIDSKGNVYAGGSFTAMNGSNAVNKLAKFLPSGMLDTTWTPNPGTVYALALDGDDYLYVGGTFSTIGGQSRSKLAKISTTGGGMADPNWNPGPSITSGAAQINALATDGAGNLYVGGTFDTIGGLKRNNIAKLSTSSGAPDLAWAPSADGAVLALACDHKGSIYSGGNFTTIDGKPRVNIAKLSTDGTGAIDDAWNPSTDNLANNNVSTITVMPDGIFAGGFYSTLAGQPRHSFAAIGIDGKLGIASDTTQPAVVNAIAAQANGGLIVGGVFSGAGSFIRSNVLRLQANGAVDPNWNVPIDALDNLSAIGVEAIATDKTGAVYIGGQFAHVGGQPRTSIAKILGNGSVDLNWGASTSIGGSFGYDWNFGVEAIALAANGDVYLGGDFNLIGGQARTGLAKISSGGVLDPNWNPAADLSDYYGIRALEVDTDGAVFVAGRIKRTGNGIVPGLAKLSGAGIGDIDPSWTNPLGIYPAALKLDHKGNLYAGDGGAIFKLSTKDGMADPNWRHSVSGNLSSTRGYQGPQIYALALDTNNNLYVGGVFTQAGNTDPNFNIANPRSRPFLAKFSTANDDPVDTGWNPVPNDAVYALATDSSNTLYVGGTFSQFGVQSRSAFAAIPTANASDPTIPDHLNQFGWTGSWYNPATSGQGLLLQIIPSQDGTNTGTLFGGWFTYDSIFSYRGTGQRWYTLQGPVDATSKTAGVPIYAPSFYSTLGATFVTQVGDAVLSFKDCNHATLIYNVMEPTALGTPYGYGNLVGGNTIALTRLGTSPICSPTGDLPYSGDFLLSGAWYDPSVRFSGFVFDIDPKLNAFFAAWYRNISAPSGAISSQRWYTIQAPYTVGTTSLDNMPIYLTTGGMLDTPSPVTTTQAGTAKIVFANCAAATFTYSFTSGPDAGTSGTLNLSRGGAKPASCNP